MNNFYNTYRYTVTYTTSNGEALSDVVFDDPSGLLGIKGCERRLKAQAIREGGVDFAKRIQVVDIACNLVRVR